MPLPSPIPPEDEILCEGCGYRLRGLPIDSNCPECGRPIAESLGHQRLPPAWESSSQQPFNAFFRTTFQVLFHPTHFYQVLETRSLDPSARSFAAWHWIASSLISGLAVWLHLVWYADLAFWNVTLPILFLSFFIPLPILLMLVVTNHAAARLTAWEARLRGYRLPMPTIQRAMHYHAPHYLPPALLVLSIVAAMHLLAVSGVTGYYSPLAARNYLYSLSAAVIASAFYLFWTYWIAMRNILYANR
jgi:hypothetical protein